MNSPPSQRVSCVVSKKTRVANTHKLNPAPPPFLFRSIRTDDEDAENDVMAATVRELPSMGLIGVWER